jgi:6-phosphogluconolactonase
MSRNALQETGIELLEFANAEALAKEAGSRFVGSIPDREPMLVALSGGRISKAFYEAIVANVQKAGRSIDHVHFFFADERCVEPTDPESNFFTARQALFDPLRVRAEQIHRIHGETEGDYAAQEAEAELCRIAPLNQDGQPILDLVILGMGEDGHTASLFPGESEGLVADSRVYRAVMAVKPPPRRITIGYAPLAAANEVWTLASGQGKEMALRQVFREISEKSARLPLARALAGRRKSLIFSDIPGSKALLDDF